MNTKLLNQNERGKRGIKGERGRESGGGGGGEKEREREWEGEQTTSGCACVKFSLRRWRLLDPRKHITSSAMTAARLLTDGFSTTSFSGEMACSSRWITIQPSVYRRSELQLPSPVVEKTIGVKPSSTSRTLWLYWCFFSRSNTLWLVQLLRDS